MRVNWLETGEMICKSTKWFVLIRISWNNKSLNLNKAWHQLSVLISCKKSRQFNRNKSYTYFSQINKSRKVIIKKKHTHIVTIWQYLTICKRGTDGCVKAYSAHTLSLKGAANGMWLEALEVSVVNEWLCGRSLDYSWQSHWEKQVHSKPRPGLTCLWERERSMHTWRADDRSWIPAVAWTRLQH